MTQRHDSVLAEDYMAFLNATTYLYKDLAKDLESQIESYDALLVNYLSNTNVYQQMNEAKEKVVNLRIDTLNRIELHMQEHKRLEYFVLNGSVAIGIHPELEPSFYDWTYNRMKSRITLH
jgi:hypothetical protein